MDLDRFIRDVPDFPIKGIIFKDITPLVGNHEALQYAVDRLAEPHLKAGIDYVAGIESRGFIFGVLLAERLKAGFAPVRKAGKLPYKTIRKSYSLEYGTSTIEMHVDAVAKGAKVLMVDDLLATGGTMVAACDLVKELGGQIAGVDFVVELTPFNGRAKLAGYDVRSLLQYNVA